VFAVTALFAILFVPTLIVSGIFFTLYVVMSI
jgi:hypothetical protein